MKTMTLRFGAVVISTALVLGAAACGGDDSESQPATSSTGRSDAGDTGSADITADALTLGDGYVGAKGPDKSMTAAFGELTNNTDKDIHLTRVVGSLPAVYQYHEVVDGVMRETADGLVVPANGSVSLHPGGNHIMIMENNDDIAAGDTVTFTLTDEDGKDYELTDVPVRVQQSGHEDYGTDGMENMEGM
jgi:copper(I)-binding protein